MWWLFIKVLITYMTFMRVDSARILAVYPTPSISHQVVFRALTLELIKRGHELVVVTPDPMFKNKESSNNLTEIDTSEEYQIVMRRMMNSDNRGLIKRGVIIDIHLILKSDGLFEPALRLFNHTDVDRLIKDQSQKFDLIIFEGLAYAPLIFSEIFNAPAIMFSSLYGLSNNYETMGAVARHPVIYPNMFRNKFRNLNIFEKIEQLYVEYKAWAFEQHAKRTIDEFLRSRFGPETPCLDELQKHIALFFVNAHPIFDGNRPVPPGTIYLGALQIQPINPLPEDLKTFLDNSKRGVVYASLGTNVRLSLMDKDLFDAFLEAFEKIPYDILWKFEGDSSDRIPKNVRVQNWFPQRDLLCHPNIKLFVMQGGLQSTDEAIDAEVPLVGIPFLGDQWYNVNKYVELGVGVAIDSMTMVADDLVKAVNTVANDPSYKENMKRLKAVMHDQPETPLQRAVWWTEHVLRHKHSRHLLGAAATISWTEYLMLDVLITLVIGFTILAFIVVKVVIYIVRLGPWIKTFVKIKQH